MADRLSGKVALVTGAARGLGRAYSVAMAAEGADIAAVDVSDCSATKSQIEGLGRKSLSLTADISTEQGAEEVVKQTLEAFGRLDILVTNAAISPEQPLDEITFADWRKVLSIDLDAVFLCIKAALGHMKSRKYGRIINISSSTYFMPFPNLCHYITAKAGVIGLTRALASELGEWGITVNALAPGLTKTERTVDVPEEVWGFQVALQSIKRPEVPEDLVGAVIFLASDEAAFITGHTLSVNGGFVMH
jgi:NAD(P)-dependent dehydrogenase (short-subunit alcohol dehydrogenase family)